MPLPGFTAEASIGPTTQVYRTPLHSGMTDSAGTVPQWDDHADALPDSEAAMEAADAGEMDQDVSDDGLDAEGMDEADMTDETDDVGEDDIEAE